MRITLFGSYDSGYPRNRTVAAGLRGQGVGVNAIHVPLWERTRDKERAYLGTWNYIKLGLTILCTQGLLLCRGLWAAWRGRLGDVIWVGFPGHVDVPVAWLLGRLTGRAVVFDVFISWYDANVVDRGVIRRGSFTAKLLWTCDWVACRLADRVILDTPQHARYFHHTLGLDPAKLGVVPVGADERVFGLTAVDRPIHLPGGGRGEGGSGTTLDVAGQERGRGPHPNPLPGGEGAGPLRVLLYAEFTPLHGADAVLDAAAMLGRHHEAIEFDLIGDGGPLHARLANRAWNEGIDNVTFHGYVPEAELVTRIAAADVCLGIFGETLKSKRVVPNKVYQCLLMGKPVVTADTAAMRATFEHGRDLLLVPAGDGRAIADAVLRLRDEPGLAAKLAEQGRAKVERQFTTGPLGERALAEVRAAVSDGGEMPLFTREAGRGVPG